MPLTIGRVEWLSISDAIGSVSIRLENKTGPNVSSAPPDPPSQELIIWKGNSSLGPKDLFVAALSRALAHGLRVRIFRRSDTNFITEVRIEAAFEGSLV